MDQTICLPIFDISANFLILVFCLKSNISILSLYKNLNGGLFAIYKCRKRKFKSSKGVAFLLHFFFVAVELEIKGISAQYALTCKNSRSPRYCRVFRCPKQCPVPKPSHLNAKGCFLDCNSPKCEAVCRGRKPSCNGVGSGCYDPRFIGSDGVVFYFHGRKGKHFSLVLPPTSKSMPASLASGLAEGHETSHGSKHWGSMFGPHTLAIEAAQVNKWNDAVDHLNFSFDGKPVQVSEGRLSERKSSDNTVKVERTGSRNSVMVLVEEIAEVSINVVPVTKEDDKIHKYGIPSDDCFTHLVVQFRFSKLSSKVEGVLGRTYRPGYESPAKQAVEMPVADGEDKYQTSSLLSPDCMMGLFSPAADN